MIDRRSDQTPPAPAAAGAFSISMAINYEDTDAGGVVYYGNYAGYMERARNACLRHIGYPVSRLLCQHQLIFVVTRANFTYRSPARLDDIIEVNLRIKKIRHASLDFHQLASRGRAVLVEGDITLAVLHSEKFRPMRLPKMLSDALSPYRIPEPGNA